MKQPRIPQQVIPLVIIFIILIATFISVRTVFEPESFGELGHYRADAIGENMDLELVYAGYEACYDCHDDIYEEKQDANHRSVSCEVCHGPAAKHVEEPEEFTPTAPRERGQCPLCHGYNAARPSGFPQILPEQHNLGKPCMSCHNPHSPTTPSAIEDCNACHRKISRVMNVSHHTTLSCEQCHVVPKEHFTNPRSVDAQKPVSRKLCGSCHDKQSKIAAGIPKINMMTHNERYMCWDCHYAHSPEAN